MAWIWPSSTTPKSIRYTRFLKKKLISRVKLIYRDAASDGDPLQKYMNHFAGKKGKGQTETTSACRNAFGRRQAEIRHHQRRKSRGRGRAQKDPGRNTGRSAVPIFTARPDQQRPARRHAHGGRFVWRAQDATAVGARLRRSDEAGGRLSRAQDGEESRLDKRPPSCWPR